jgi:hypothetical protein
MSLKNAHVVEDKTSRSQAGGFREPIRVRIVFGAQKLANGDKVCSSRIWRSKISQLEGEELKFSGKYGGTSTPCSFYFSIASPWRVLFMLQIDNVKPSNNDEISQLMRPTYPRSTKLDDLIVVSGIH